jgi:hypothetical protein
MPQPFRSGRDHNSTILINIKSKSWIIFSTIQTATRGVTRPTCKLVHTITGGRERPQNRRALCGSTTKTIKRNLAVVSMGNSIY